MPKVRHFLSWGLVFATTAAIAHSPMYPDGFDFDESNQGHHPELQRRTNNTGAQAVRNPITQCVNGLAGDYPCKNIQLMAFMAKANLGGNGSNLNDVWGWTDLTTGREIAIVGKTNGTAFVDVTDPINPLLLAFLPSRNGGNESWRDIKIYADHAFIVADGSTNNNHGLQIYDLRELRGISPGSIVASTASLGGFGAAHNIVINEASGFAYVVGANACSGGLFMVDISNPQQPINSGCYSADGYTHDAQCVNYAGPDTTYFGREICVAYNEDSITIVDVTNKGIPQTISRTTYSQSRYTHQGWFLDDNHSYLIMNDELDESGLNINTTSHLYDVSDLDNPVEVGRYRGVTQAIDHNLYTLDGFVFESNYRAGLRILRADNIASGELEEVAYFDTIPCSNSAAFSGTWSSYIYFPSGNIVTSDIGGGLFVLQADWAAINDPNLATDTQPVVAPICSGDDPDNGALGGRRGGGGNAAWLLLVGGFLLLARSKWLRNVVNS